MLLIERGEGPPRMAGVGRLHCWSYNVTFYRKEIICDNQMQLRERTISGLWAVVAQLYPPTEIN